MIIKQSDDKQSQLLTLQSLLSHPLADSNTKKRIEQEIRNIQAGIRGEEEAAYEMKVHFGESKNWMVIHDLRIEHGDLVAQIDHLIINRWLQIWVCESKHFAEGIAINDHGEFAAFFGNRPYGVPSPIEQNNRHIRILTRLFESGAVQLPTRLGFTIKPELKSLILVSKRARISRPKSKIDGLEAVIKNDSLFKTIDKTVDEGSVLSMARVIGADTLESTTREIAKLHKPIKFNWLGKFGLSEPPQAAMVTPPPTSIPAKSEGQDGEDTKRKQKLICHSCSCPIPYNVAKFCWSNKSKFSGNLFCFDCQKKVTAA